MKVIMGGDFNARTSRQGGGVKEKKKRSAKGESKSKDLVINKESRRLIELLEVGG